MSKTTTVISSDNSTINACSNMLRAAAAAKGRYRTPPASIFVCVVVLLYTAFLRRQRTVVARTCYMVLGAYVCVYVCGTLGDGVYTLYPQHLRYATDVENYQSGNN